jgi:hypothetical protein
MYMCDIPPIAIVSSTFFLKKSHFFEKWWKTSFKPIKVPEHVWTARKTTNMGRSGWNLGAILHTETTTCPRKSLWRIFFFKIFFLSFLTSWAPDALMTILGLSNSRSTMVLPYWARCYSIMARPQTVWGSYLCLVDYGMGDPLGPGT